ncbi:type II toxin-antitoxin system VapB family antitoxin [Sediminicoccus sp. KRV36]|uniref:type II toxin-antitoxin system VapB family antitoxin n=1 Tax=Sediminicoccus sp. KRV36 TaxID=3133721 RepID=UPI00200C7221|nr:type II toxin-antitoxin system VapB family antitoxin [Sediminicoccus rosea]UPY37891.1 type II toxin-antitoxin system VapB family antitoxin [Sediminicoccus rosea]
MGQLNIKDEVLIAEAKALAAEMGTSTIGALRLAVQSLRATREREKRATQEAKIAAAMAIAARVAELVPPHLRKSDHSDLYDEDGLPR